MDAFERLEDRIVNYGYIPKDAEWELCNEEGWTLAHVFANHKPLPAAAVQYYKLASSDGWTVAHQAAYRGTLPADFFMWHLLDANAASVLHVAARYGHLPEHMKTKHSVEKVWNKPDVEGLTPWEIHVERVNRQLSSLLKTA